MRCGYLVAYRSWAICVHGAIIIQCTEERPAILGDPHDVPLARHESGLKNVDMVKRREPCRISNSFACLCNEPRHFVIDLIERRLPVRTICQSHQNRQFILHAGPAKLQIGQ